LALTRSAACGNNCETCDVDGAGNAGMCTSCGSNPANGILHVSGGRCDLTCADGFSTVNVTADGATCTGTCGRRPRPSLMATDMPALHCSAL